MFHLQQNKNYFLTSRMDEATFTLPRAPWHKSVEDYGH